MSFLRRVYVWVKSSLLVVWLLLLMLVGAKLTRQNPQLIDLDLIFWRAPSASLGVIISMTLVLGVVLGIAAMLPILFYTRLKLRRLVNSLQNTGAIHNRSAER